ncbi:isochorismatase family protein [Pseudoalteromonas ulvae]|uniref:Hydrolase n=1 Tax=Pseudoalteromonas ulvae TaxID=107327 RepID=A0A244CTM3_PSEDV|nr:isochorismatase family protein [Pseudoalteromonas ulvae]OUL58806.1 hydrolase [Pseudoalteromonas ulvae]
MLNKQTTGLLVIDIQGTLATLVHDSERMIAQTQTLLKGAQLLGLPILAVEQNPDKLGGTVPSLAEYLPAAPVTKMTFDACGNPDFSDKIQQSVNEGITQWLVVGIEAHICVYQTVMSLLSQGLQVELVTECLSSRTLSNKELAIANMLQAGARQTSVEMCLFELMGDCLAPEFKSVLKLIKSINS